ncbi:MAG: hypothetical protein GX933_08495 [Chloroflexi bacterium]|nr:hypothetical protein [Chloroflexota bacterium]
MPILTDWDIQIDVDDVLRAQNARPEILKKRSPQLIPIAEQALEEACTLFKPFVMYKILSVEKLEGNHLTLENDYFVDGEIVSKYLTNSNSVIFAACTISDTLEKKVSDYFISNPSYALALNGAGIAGVHKLSMMVKNYFKDQIIPDHCLSTMALNPGMVGWPLAEGQSQVFSVLSSVSDNIRLSSSSLMIPSKSTSFIMGVGQNVNPNGSHCDYCNRKYTCFMSDYAVGNKQS